MVHVDDEGRRSRFRGPRGGGGRSGIVALLAVVGAVALFMFVSRLDLFGFGFDLPDWFDGGESDPAPRGDVLYEGQRAESASERFLIDVGDGEATVAIQARQEWDTRGGLFSGDFVYGNNGTSSVADPDDRGSPARLKVAVDYCAEGEITAERDEPDGPVAHVTFDLGELFVCGTTLEHTPDNDAAFRQDDTPTRFHGEFVSFVSGAAETTAAAAACPTDELERFSSPEYVAYVRTQLAERFGIPESSVDVVTGRVGRTDREAQDELRQQLEGYANRQDPDDPDRTYESLDVQYLQNDGSAVADSCWREPGGQDLDDLDDVDAPRPEDR
jgi:hypothetical protein